jgi:hypothetical protein
MINRCTNLFKYCNNLYIALVYVLILYLYTVCITYVYIGFK